MFKYSLFSTHWMPFVCHTTKLQHFNHSRHKNFTTNKRQKDKKPSRNWYTTVRQLTPFILVFFFFWTGRRMGESGKRCCTVWQETKTESRDDRVKTDTLIVTRAQFYSVWENFISCLFRKISRQEKKFTHKCPLGLPSKKYYSNLFLPSLTFFIVELVCIKF